MADGQLIQAFLPDTTLVPPAKMIVDGLPGAAGGAGLLRDVAVPATQAGSSVADPAEQG